VAEKGQPTELGTSAWHGARGEGSESGTEKVSCATMTTDSKLVFDSRGSCVLRRLRVADHMSRKRYLTEWRFPGRVLAISSMAW
jgi:hypothetical protein